MQEVATTATLVDDGALAGGAVTAVLSRDEIESMLGAASPGLWFELGYEDEEPAGRVTIDLAPADIEEMLRLAEGDEVVLALDGDWVSGALGEPPDVEAHGLRGALAIAVVAGAIAAPAGLAATPQVSGAAAPQVSSQAVSSQVSSAAVRGQVSRQVVSSQVTRAVSQGQVARAGAKTQVSRSLVVKAGGVSSLKNKL
jgi:hypothetical protein